MSPATNTDPISRSISRAGPAKAPSAPASFQSPAPRLRSRTNGSSKAKPISCAEQGRLQSAPAPEDGVGNYSDHQSRHRQPVRDAAAAQIGPAGDQREQHGARQNDGLQTSLRLHRWRAASRSRLVMFRIMILKKIHFVTVQKSPARRDRRLAAAFAITPRKSGLLRGFSHSREAKSMKLTADAFPCA